MNINTLKIVEELKDDGFTEDQAKVILGTVMTAIQESDLVSKDFLESKLAILKADLIAEVARRFTDLEITTVNRISESEKRTAAQMTHLETKLETKIGHVETKIGHVEAKIGHVEAKIVESEKRVMSHITTLREDMYKLETRFITWVVGAQLTTIILILGIFYFFFSQILVKILPQ